MTPAANISFRQRLARVFFFFPFQLVLVHLKKNHTLLFFWLILLGFVTQLLAARYGAPNLFLAPEYLNAVGFWSYFIIGLSLGIFIMAYNIASYTSNGSKFSFIVTLNRPFLKYSGNNTFFPLTFLFIYIFFIVQFHRENEMHQSLLLLLDIIGLVGGIFVFLVLGYVYFFSTNKNIFTLFKLKKDKNGKLIRNPKDIPPLKRKWWQLQAPLSTANEWRVETYFANPWSIRLARGSEHYPKELLIRVFNQNHLNATRFEITVFLLLLAIGFFRENHYFQIPAGASIVLIMAMFLIIISVLKSWLSGWSTIVFVAIILIINQFSKHDQFSYANYAYGMDYTGKKAAYTDAVINGLKNNSKNYQEDFIHTVEILHNWRLANSKYSLMRKQKPRLVIVNCSGGGLRSAMWTFHAMAYVDSILNGALLNHTQMITGSSGGMLGAAYLRELYLQSKTDSTINIYDDKYLDNISKDLLNPVGFAIAVNDLFIRLQKFQDGEYIYTKDRGYAFEQAFNKNTGWALNKRLSDYTEPEAKGLIPMMLMAPTITSDARRMLIASQPVSYLTNNNPLKNVTNMPSTESIEFSRFFAEQNPGNLRFTSALRINATFPYITPTASMPSEPVIHLMDAGVRDNFGMKITLRYIYAFRNWISSNTSGVVIVQIRDKSKERKIKDVRTSSKLESLFTPLGTVYNNITTVHNYNQDELLQYASLWFDGQIDVVSFQLKNEGEERISLSWHLTNKEKRQILQAIELPENQQSIEKLKELID
ncbi:MAG: phospholipase [Flavobacteriales bacterium]|nr:MAG: phospholipase [Flavobacteriales bacterium]